MYSIFRTPQKHHKIFDSVMRIISFLPLKIYLQKKSKTHRIYYGFYTHSLGHVLHEFDYVFQLSTKKQSPSIIIFEKSQFTQQITCYYRSKGYKVLTGGFLNYLIGLNYNALKDFIFLISMGHEFLFIRNHRYSTLELSLKFTNYLDIRFNWNNNNTLWENLKLDKKIFEKLNININEKYVTVQIKTNKANQNIMETNPNIYFKVLKILNDHGYKIIFMGREKMPTEWQCLNIIDYANSQDASFSNDLSLTKYSHLNLSTASGFFLIADLLHIPSCVVNVWQVLWPPFDSNTVFIPQLLKRAGKIVSLYEQVDLNFEYSTHIVREINNLLNKYEPVETDSDIILETILDILNNEHKLNNVLRDQLNIPARFKSLPLNLVESQISKKLIESYPEYLFNFPAD